MALDERAFFNERPEQRNGRYGCPRCHRTNDYQMRWIRRTKKDRLPGNADEGDRAKFLKLRDHLIRVDDELTCKTCGKRFEIPSMHSLVFVDQTEGLPKVDDDEAEPDASTAPAPSANAPAGSTPSTPAPRQRKGYAPPKAWR
ncbi:MAG: hypothetical protein KA371_21075 [Acidobacteria bacterium]|nr:hypothetical protein [Acidobacteriota bacterium]